MAVTDADKLLQEVSLKSIVLEILSKDEMSISALSRLLVEKGYRLHRLEVAGFCKGLVSAGILKVRLVRPCLLFSVPKTGSEDNKESPP